MCAMYDTLLAGASLAVVLCFLYRDMGDFFYVVSEGKCDILVNGKCVRDGEYNSRCAVASAQVCAPLQKKKTWYSAYRLRISAPLSLFLLHRYCPLLFRSLAHAPRAVRRKVIETGKGKGFGELALLYDAPRAATVVATSDVRAWAVDRVTFKHVMIGTTMRKVRAQRHALASRARHCSRSWSPDIDALSYLIAEKSLEEVHSRGGAAAEADNMRLLPLSL